MLPLRLADVSEVVALAAHCDDIALGAGATLLMLAAQSPGLRVRAVVLTGGGTAREVEEREALAAFLPGACIDVSVMSLPDGRLPECWGEVKSALQEAAQQARPDLVLAPQRADAHQDHRLVAKLAPTAFRDHLILGYEILKFESDLPRSNLYIPVNCDVAERKADLLAHMYPSQAAHDWFDRAAFLGLMRVRGAQCHTGLAEAFLADKLLMSLNVEA